MPKIALISDVHANLIALKAVIEKLEEFEPDVWICLGDIVGYGPEPSECINLIQKKEMICVLGNHDSGVAGILKPDHFRNPNRRVIEMTKSMLSSSELKWLSNLPLVIENDEWIAAHSSPEEPQKWKYLESAILIRSMLEKLPQKYCFIGHTHKPVLVSDKLGKLKIDAEGNYLINPGSVGQSRDGDYRASCGLLDTEKREYQNFRVEYDLQGVITLLLKMGFSEMDSNHLMRSK